jgi:hypothetical protein
MIDELAHAGPEHLDPAFVAGYDRKQGHPDPAPDVAVFAAHASTGPRRWSTSRRAPGSSRSQLPGW